MSDSEQRLLTKSGELLDDQGNLNDYGWARQPVLDANLEKAHFYRLRFLQPLRMKRWDYYGIFTPDYFFSFTISDVGYLGMVFAYVVDFKQKTCHEETISIPFAKGVILPRNSIGGESNYHSKKVTLKFEVGKNQRRIQADWKGFNEKGLSADISLATSPEHESMTIVIPIVGKRFYYNRKMNCLPASGWVEYLGQRHEIIPDTCLGSLDWGRGVWEYASFWVWASASGFLADRRRVGLNLGFGFGDTSAATENAIILDGCVHKLGQVDFDYKSGDFMRPWKMTSPDGRLNLTFTPFYERVAKTDAKILSSEVHQMFGKYNGTFVSDSQETIEIKDLTGFAEEHHARW